VSEVAGLETALDRCIFRLEKNRTNDGTPAGQNRRQPSRNACHSRKDEGIQQKEVNAWRKETTAYQEKTEATDLEANREGIESEAEHEVRKDKAALETYGALKERYGDRHLAVGRRQLKKRTQGDGGSRKKLAVARKGMTRRAIPAPRKGHGGQGHCCKRSSRGHSCRARKTAVE
jgi:hypothetical protein